MTTSAVGGSFSVAPDAVVPGASLVIPLQPRQLASGGYKMGINITLSDPATGATVEGVLYEFDTGGKGFFAAIPPGQPFPRPAQTFGQIYNHYASGIEYFGDAVYLDVSFPDSPSSESYRMLVGLVNRVSNDKKHASADEAQLPIFGYFWGDFGGSLQATPIVAAPTGHPQRGNDVSLLTVLEQLPGPYGGSGFIVNLGPFPSASSTVQPSVIVGLTPALRQAFPATVAMNALADDAYPPSGQEEPPGSVATYPEQILTGTLQIGETVLPNVPIVLDTGAPNTTLHHGEGLPDTVKAKENDSLKLTVQTTSGQTVTLLDFIVGNDASVNHVLEGGHRAETESGGSGKPGKAPGYINTGIAAFFNQPICFDFGEKVVRFVGAS